MKIRFSELYITKVPSKLHIEETYQIRRSLVPRLWLYVHDYAKVVRHKWCASSMWTRLLKKLKRLYRFGVGEHEASSNHAEIISCPSQFPKKDGYNGLSSHTRNYRCI